MSLHESLKKFIEEKSIDTHETGQSWVMDCLSPSCGKEKHMYLRKEDGRGKCFRCGTSWDWRQFVSDVEHCSRDEAWGVLFKGGTPGGAARLKLDIDMGDEEEDITDQDEPYIELSEDFIHVDQSDEGMSYLESRGVTDPQTIVDFDIRWHDVMEAVVFPISRDGYVYGWQARKVNPGPDEPRLLTKTGFNKSRHLLNYDVARTKNEIVLVEGPIDCVKVAQAGYGAVCSFGKLVSHRQIEMLLKAESPNIYVGLDPDAAKEASDVIAILSASKKVFRVNPPEGRKDFGECSPEEVRQAMADAVPLESKSSMIEIFWG